MGSILGTVAVVGIVALVVWGVINNGPVDTQNQTVPAATQTTPDPAPAVSAVAPDATVAPEPMVEPEPVPQEAPEPAPEVAPLPTPAPVPEQTN